MEKLGISGRMIQRLTRSRGITLNSRPAYLSRAVRPGDVVAVRIAERETPTLAPLPDLPLTVIHEDADLIVVDKPSGTLVHPTSAHHTRTLSHAVARHLAEQGIEAKVRPVHRLDRETSGLVVFAKSAYAHQHLDRQLREGTLDREYLAVVEGAVAEASGVIDLAIGRHHSNPRLRMVRQDGQEAVTHFWVTTSLLTATVLRVNLQTGRTHQIRVHLAHSGHPVVGDLVYGARRTRHITRPALHARRVTLRSPRSSEMITAEAPLPADIAKLIETLRQEG